MSASNVQVVYHGTPFEFEKFSLSAIGSSEGAAAYGHGLYFTQHREIAIDYSGNRDLSGASVPTFYIINGERTAPGEPSQKAADLLHSAGTREARRLASEMLKDANQGAEWTADKGIDYYREVYRLTHTLTQRDVRRAPSFLITAAIPADGCMLHWHLPLCEQPAPVRDALRDFLKASNLQADEMDTGSTLYKSLALACTNSGGAAYISNQLREIGIAGIKYRINESALKATDKGAGFNFVIFDPEDINVKKVHTLAARKRSAGPSLTL